MASTGKYSTPEFSGSRRSGTDRIRMRRFEPTPVYVLAEHLKREGIRLHAVDGPWRPTRRPLRRPGRNAEQVIPVVTNGIAEIAVDTAEHAIDVSGLLNWCGVDHLEPVPNLRPPDGDVVRT
jgi:hypothetical protein